MPPKAWKTLSSRRIYENPWMKLREDIAEMPNGKTTLYTVIRNQISPGDNSQFSNALLVVAKRPAPGQTKTRLSPPLTPDRAAALYECFLRDTLDLVRQVPETQPVIAFLPSSEEAYFSKLAPDFELIGQEGADLGARLDNALTHYLQLGYQRVVIMDSDSPTLPLDCLVTAFAALDEADVVLGPCDDGGYYLIGLKQPVPRLLREVPMSTPTVTTDTLVLATKAGLRVKLLPIWYDIDNVATLNRLRAELAGASNGTARHTRAFLVTNGDILTRITVNL